MNKYQQALDLSLEHKRIMDFHLEKFPKAQEALYNDKDFKEYVSNVDSYCEKYKDYPGQFLQELVNKTKTPTLEEVIKDWEKLGYRWIVPSKYSHMILLVDYDEEEKWILTIRINTQTKKIWKDWGDGSLESFTFEEHQLLTKTVKAVGVEDE